MKIIPFVKPWITKTELINSISKIDINDFGGLGKVSSKLEKYFEKRLVVKRALIVGACTHALEISLFALDLKKNDEVVCPSYTFVSTVSSIIKVGAKAVFVDIEEETLGLDPVLVEKAINSKTKAVILVHYGGIPAKVKEIKDICDKHKIILIEDAAQAFLVKENGKYIGTFGSMGCFSFHNTKNVTSGEGGMLVVSESNKKLIEVCEEIRSFGTNREAFLRKDVDVYEWQRIGGSYFLTDIQSALISSQLKKYNKILSERNRVCEFYVKNLKRLEQYGVRICKHPSNSNYHLFWILCKSKKERKKLLQKLREAGIQASSHFPTLHLSPFVIKNKNRFKISGSLNVSETVSKNILRLPIYPGLTNKNVSYICSVVNDFYT